MNPSACRTLAHQQHAFGNFYGTAREGLSVGSRRGMLKATQDSTDGRNHWPVVMSMCLAGGGLRHGQVIGATESDGGQIKERAVTPGDLAATIYRHMGVPLDATYLDNRGRPRYIVENGGQPIAELF